MEKFLAKLKESFLSVFPITLIIIVLVCFLGNVSLGEVVALLFSAILLIVGISLFSLGTENSMIELGQNIGSSLSKSKKLWLMLLISFIIGFIITFAEPDLMVLAIKVADKSSLNSVWIFIATVSLGVGLFLMLAIFKLVFRWRLSLIMTITYGAILILSFFVPKQFIPIAFDSGSVTTGPISVPFLLSFGLGLSAVRSGNNEDDSFGLIALCSAGPILAVMLISLFLTGGSSLGGQVEITTGIFERFLLASAGYIKDVALVILPIVLLFFIFQFFVFKFPKQKVFRTIFGFFITYLGIVMFLTGVECGYSNLGYKIGSAISGLSYNYIAIPISFVLGASSVMAEPALHVLKKQVENITGGVIKQKVIVTVISFGVACSVAVAVMQNMYDFSLLYVIVPVYVVSLFLTFFNTKLFTAVAFDSGGVATGAMAVSFVLPFVMGLSSGSAQGFGTIALIAAFPILSMQILGAIYKIVLLKKQGAFKNLMFWKKQSSFEIIEFDIDILQQNNLDNELLEQTNNTQSKNFDQNKKEILTQTKNSN